MVYGYFCERTMTMTITLVSVLGSCLPQDFLETVVSICNMCFVGEETLLLFSFKNVLAGN